VSEEVNPARNTTVQLLSVGTDPVRLQNVDLQRYRRTDRQTTLRCQEPNTPQRAARSANKLSWQQCSWAVQSLMSPGFLVDKACGHRRPRHWMFHLHDCPLSATERSPSPQHEHGTECQLKW